MTLRHMKIFTAVFRNSNITRAAEELHLAQPSVSLAIKELEEYYGIRLFERIGRGISPQKGQKNFTGTRSTSSPCSMKWRQKSKTGIRWVPCVWAPASPSAGTFFRFFCNGIRKCIRSLR